jgi:hypothetical protein
LGARFGLGDEPLGRRGCLGLPAVSLGLSLGQGLLGALLKVANFFFGFLAAAGRLGPGPVDGRLGVRAGLGQQLFGGGGGLFADLADLGSRGW